VLKDSQMVIDNKSRYSKNFRRVQVISESSWSQH